MLKNVPKFCIPKDVEQFSRIENLGFPPIIKPPFTWSPRIRLIENATTREALEAACRASNDNAGHQRGSLPTTIRQLSESETSAATKADHRLRIAESNANRFVTLTFGDGDKFKFDPDLVTATSIVCEWMHRLGSKFYGHAYKRIEDSELSYFCAVPERWDKVGNPVPLHYHVTMHVPDNVTEWFDAHAGKLWHQTALRVLNICGGHADVAPIYDLAGLASYNTKHCDINWTVGAMLTEDDIAAYRRYRAI